MADYVKQVLTRYTTALTAGAAGTETTIQLPDWAASGVVRAMNWEITALRFSRTSGTAANYTFRLGDVAAFVAGSVNEVIVYGALAVGTRINDVFASPIPVTSDATNRLYFRPTWDAGADNAAQVRIFFRPVYGLNAT